MKILNSNISQLTKPKNIGRIKTNQKLNIKNKKTWYPDVYFSRDYASAVRIYKGMVCGGRSDV